MFRPARNARQIRRWKNNYQPYFADPMAFRQDRADLPRRNARGNRKAAADRFELFWENGLIWVGSNNYDRHWQI